MTTKLKASRFNIRRLAPAPARPQPVTGEMLFDNHDDGFGKDPFPTAAKAAAPQTAPQPAPSPAPAAAMATKVPRADQGVTEALAAIAAEGLTGRQLRTARRLAQNNRLNPASDHEAVRLLRLAGIDPFNRSSMLDVIVPKTAAQEDADVPAVQQADAQKTGRALTALPGDPVRLPQNVQPIRVPSTEQRAVSSHAAEILQMQQDIARRRRRKLILLAARMMVFVFLPTFLAGWYYFRLATPFYSTRSEFVIQQAGPAAAAGFSSMFSGTALATSQDSIAVQGYLQSRDAMMRLDKDVGFRSHFQNPDLDMLQRLAPDASLESAYGVYKKFVKIAYDPTEGIIKMEVIAADPDVAAAWASQLISYAEEQVDHLTQRMRADQMRDALASYNDAVVALQVSQRGLIELQERFKILSSEAEVGLLTAQISALETQLTQERLSLAQMQANESPNQARMDPVQRRMVTLEDQISQLRAKMTESSADGDSLARVQGELLVAQADVQTRQLILAQSLQAMETSRTEANRQVRYLSISVNPTVTDAPAYPRAFENTLVAMLILLGIYLMVSMTAAILREQVSA